MESALTVRRANHDDIPALEAIERQVWGPLGTEVYQRPHFEAWLETYPEGFWLVCENGAPVAFTFLLKIDFSPDRIGEMRTFNDVTDHGFARATHRPTGSHHFGITVCSIRRGAGKLLAEATLDAEHVAAERIAVFGSLAESARRNGNLIGSSELVAKLIEFTMAEKDLVLRAAGSQALGALDLPSNKASEIIRAQHRG